MNDAEKVVLRFTDGTVLKGYLRDFSPKRSSVSFEKYENKETHSVELRDLKAIFFVKTFTGDSQKTEKKIYGISKPKGKRVFIKFKDNEHLVGFLEGDAQLDLPWDRGFYLSKDDKGIKGFFLLPVDLDSNNIKVFVVASSIGDVTVVP